jgi:tyrosinase
MARVRKNVWKLKPTDKTLEWYERAVTAMKARPIAEATSWRYQAAIHEYNRATDPFRQSNDVLPTAGERQKYWTQCQHGSWYFLSWHRMYLYHFETIVAAEVEKLGGPADWALPYWNYSDDRDANARLLPTAFRSPKKNDGSDNALFVNTRTPDCNAGRQFADDSDVAIAGPLREPDFVSLSFGTGFGGPQTNFMHSGNLIGSLELTPHGNMHMAVGGLMQSFSTAALDPIFWLHHANIDRLWKKWIALGGGRDNPTSDTAWMNQTFTFFDENGAQKTFTGAQIVNTVTQLGYRYDDDPLVYWPYFWPYVIAPTPPPPPAPSASPAPTPDQQVKSQEPLANVQQPVRLTDKRQDVKIAVPQAARSVFTTSQAAKFAGERWILQLQDIQYDAPVGVSYMLFLNLPDGGPDPDHTSPNYIGTLGFFGKTESGTHPGMTEGGLSAEYDVTAVVQRLGSIDEIKLSAIPNYPKAPPDRPDLARAIAQLKPQGNPRFGRIILLKQKIE